jgi:hypothetical protein
VALLRFALFFALLVPIAAHADPPVKEVEVVNFPAVQEVSGAVEVTNDDTNPVEIVGEVEVTNLPASSGPARFQLVGFTTATYSGNLRGHFGATDKCQLEFADSRMCTEQEVRETTTIPSGLVGDGWANPLLDSSSLNCVSWTEGSHEVQTGTIVLANGTSESRGDHFCLQEKSIACCAPVP